MDNILTAVILGITLFFTVFGVLFGLKRGAFRSIVRLITLGVGIAIAWFGRKAYVSAVMALEFDGQSINSLLEEAAAEAGALSGLIGALLESLLTVILFITVVLALKFVTAVIFFIVGFFLPKPKQRGIGALIGLLQGALIAFCICAPLNGLLCNCSQLLDTFSQPIGGEVLLPEEDLAQMKANGIDFEAYAGSTVAKLYSSVGGSFYNALAASETEDGKSVSISGTVEVVEVGVKFAEAMQSISELDMSNGISAESRNELRDTFKELDAIKADMSDEAKDTINTMISALVSEAAGSEELPPELVDQLENIDFGEISFETEGNLVLDFADYAENGAESEVTITDLVNGLADSTLVLPVLENMVEAEGNAVELPEAEKAEVTNAINNLNDAEKQETLRKLFGIQ
jgi:uncharacterized membrane protein required for colicin V production